MNQLISRSNVLRALVAARDISALVTIVLSVIVKELNAPTVIDM